MGRALGRAGAVFETLSRSAIAKRGGLANWNAAGWDAAGWDAEGWDAEGWRAAGWRTAGWRAAIAVPDVAVSVELTVEDALLDNNRRSRPDRLPCGCIMDCISFWASPIMSLQTFSVLVVSCMSAWFCLSMVCVMERFLPCCISVARSVNVMVDALIMVDTSNALH